jgi:hypothetical protein
MGVGVGFSSLRLQALRPRPLCSRSPCNARAVGAAFGLGLACGFGTLGHFANYYRRKFKELPSDTFRRARAQAELRVQGSSLAQEQQ